MGTKNLLTGHLTNGAKEDSWPFDFFFDFTLFFFAWPSAFFFFGFSKNVKAQNKLITSNCLSCERTMIEKLNKITTNQKSIKHSWAKWNTTKKKLYKTKDLYQMTSDEPEKHVSITESGGDTKLSDMKNFNLVQSKWLHFFFSYLFLSLRKLSTNYSYFIFM